MDKVTGSAERPTIDSPTTLPAALGYRSRHPEDGVLHRVITDHLETFLAEARARGDGEGLPHFVERELREFLRCGQLARGFARFQCEGCRKDLLVALSCKGRAVCPSCTGRRMASLAAHLVDNVLGGLPVRQWVLTVPHRLRYALAWDHCLCRTVLGVFIRALLADERRRAKRYGIHPSHGGAVTAIQRFGSALNLNLHYHCLAVQGVFADDGSGGLRFIPLPAPTDREVERLLATVRRRIVRLAKRHGIDLDGEGAEAVRVDALAEESPVLAGLAGASVAGVAAMGSNAGMRPERLRAGLHSTPKGLGDPCHANVGGFDLHAAVAVPAGDRTRLEHLARYVLRPPVAQDALERAPDGRVLLRIRRPWSDGTRAIVFEPLELLARLASLIPRPHVHLLLYHGVFAPHAQRRRNAVAHARKTLPAASAPAGVAADVRSGAGWGPSAGEPEAAAPVPSGASGVQREAHAPRSDDDARDASGGLPLAGEADRGTATAPRRGRPWFKWADLMRRVFEIDVLACTSCGGRLRLIATIEDPEVIRRILAHLGLPTALPATLPARSPPPTMPLPFD